METQKKSFNVSAKHAGAFVVLACVLAVVGIVARALDPNNTGGPNVSTPQAPAVQVPPAHAYVASHALSKEQAASALSDYLGQAQRILRHLSMLQDRYVSGLRQAVQWKSQEQSTKKTQSMKEATEEARDVLFAIPVPEDLSDQDADQIEAVQNAVLELAIAILDMDADVAVHTHTGIDREPALTKQIAAVNKARHDFESQAMKTYKYFGFPPKQIDRQTFKIKQSDRPRNPYSRV
jgi:negative regulator of sigma E activity